MTLQVEDSLVGVVLYTQLISMHPGDPNVFAYTATTADITAYGYPQKVAGHGSGAGLTSLSGRQAAVGEAVERYAASVVHPEDLLYGAYDDLVAAGENPIHPSRWALYDPSQYSSVPFPRFTRGTPIVWTRVENVSRQELSLAPASLIYMPYVRIRGETEEVVGIATSTGLACGPTRAHAWAGALAELVERDAFAIMWRNRLSCPRVHVDGKSALGRQFPGVFQRPYLEYSFFLTTQDIRVPAVFGILRDTRRAHGGIIVGGAAHLDPARALLKTALELVQGLKWVDYMATQDLPAIERFEDVHTFEHRVQLYGFGDMRPAFDFLYNSGDEIRLSEIEDLSTADLHGDIGTYKRLFSERHLEIFGVDLTPVDVALSGRHVVRAVVPELETIEGDHRYPLLGGKRWRSVPVQNGRMLSLPELSGINPYPHPYP
jgi:ribosomal protein S12 methylthiotransferase accessory factor